MIVLTIDSGKMTRQINMQDQRLRDIHRTQKSVLDRIDRRFAYWLQGEVVRRYRGIDLRVRSGLLWRSVQVGRFMRGAVESWIIGTPVHYAGVQEDGDTIVPKGTVRPIIKGRRADGTLVMGQSTGTKLLVPSDEARTEAGVGRDVHIDQIALNLSRGEPYTTFVEDGKLYMAVNKDVTWLGTLVSSVTITGTRTWQRLVRVMARRLPRDYQKEMQREIRRKGGAR